MLKNIRCLSIELQLILYVLSLIKSRVIFEDKV